MFGFNSPTVPQVEAEIVKKAIDAKENVTILDVRTPPELLRGKIAGSINIPVDEIVRTVEAVLPDKEQTIYVHCLSGSRSVMAVSEMVTLGYTHVYDMKSGLLSWRAKGFPTQ